MANAQTSSGVALAQEDLRKDQVERLMALSVNSPISLQSAECTPKLRSIGRLDQESGLCASG